MKCVARVRSPNASSVLILFLPSTLGDASGKIPQQHVPEMRRSITGTRWNGKLKLTLSAPPRKFRVRPRLTLQASLREDRRKIPRRISAFCFSFLFLSVSLFLILSRTIHFVLYFQVFYTYVRLCVFIVRPQLLPPLTEQRTTTLLASDMGSRQGGDLSDARLRLCGKSAALGGATRGFRRMPARFRERYRRGT